MCAYKYVNNIKVYGFDGFESIISHLIETRTIGVALNSDKLTYCDDTLREIINSNTGYCDGIGAVWALKKKGIKKEAVKIAGCELWLEIIKQHPDKTYYLVGAEEATICETVKKLQEEYPGINIVGYRNGFINSEQEKTQLFEDIKAKSPDFVFAAMGSPKQEYLLSEIHSFLPVPMLGLGGSFNVYTGKVKRAPKWMLKLNLEALYRYIFCNIKFNRMKSDMKFVVNLILNRM